MTSMERLQFEVRLTVRSPFVFRGLASPLFGIDTAHVRDPRGRPLIPADQVRGCLRWAAEHLNAAGCPFASADRLHRLFGAADDEEGGAPAGRRRSDLIFSDLTAEGLDGETLFETTRVAIDDELGAAQAGALQIVELVAPFGRDVRFTGGLLAFAPAGEKDNTAALLGKALGVLASIGAMKSSGFGEIVFSELTLQAATPVTVQPAQGADRLRRYWLTFDRPYLVDADWISQNAFEGAAVVPGGALKGALAQALRRAGHAPEDGALGQALSALRISHAFPSAIGGEMGGLPLPLSLVAVGTEGGAILGDALRVPFGRGAMIGGRPALFSPDWKPDVASAAAIAMGLPLYDEPDRIVRTHTAISDDEVADEGQLFTSVARSHLDGDGEPRRWFVAVDATAIEAGEQAALLLGAIEAGLDGTGKTGARAEFERREDKPRGAPAVAPVHGSEDAFALVLRTPALMLDPLTAKDAREGYETYFSAALAGAELLSFFAAQYLAGRHAARAYRPYGAIYYPWLVTAPGAVFLLKAKPGQGAALRARLNDLLASGLPLPELSGAEPLDWRNCPFTPENGYGAFTADHLSGPETAALTERVAHV